MIIGRCFRNMTECCICQGHVRVPVRFTCFDCCTRMDPPNCHSVMRVCLYCAQEYLELNKQPHLRPVVKKCLTCPCFAYPRQLSFTNAFEKDFLLMSMDTRTDIQCQCGFIGNQNELDRHSGKDCSFRLVLQPVCITMTKHEGRCKICTMYVTNMEDHLLYQHKYIRCPFCKIMVQESYFTIHYNECPENRIPCNTCKHAIPANRMKKHLQDHMQTALDNITEYSRLLTVAKDQLDNIIEI